jgi:hypothetical protein
MSREIQYEGKQYGYITGRGVYRRFEFIYNHYQGIHQEPAVGKPGGRVLRLCVPKPDLQVTFGSKTNHQKVGPAFTNRHPFGV